MTGRNVNVVVYSSPLCGYCSAAKRLLKRKKVEFEEINVLFKPEMREEMRLRSHRTTVPQIFIGDRHVGGYDDLAALEAAGRLDVLLGFEHASGECRTGPRADFDDEFKN